jgi:putative ABC transport system ATP-binding protein
MVPASPQRLDLDLAGIEVALADRRGAPRTLLAVPAFRLAGGSQLAVCGPSGSGKTTLLNLLAGLVRPTRGSVRWGAVTVSGLAEGAADRWRRETLGLVFQRFHLFSGMSAVENVLLPLRFDRWTIAARHRTAALDLLEQIGVRPDLETSLLSRGEQQRVALARAVLRRPAILLADEPTASLDRESAGLIADLLCTLCRDIGATLVVATHDPELAARLDCAVDIVGGGLNARGAVSRCRQLVEAE